jgi:hypothetical protein
VNKPVPLPQIHGKPGTPPVGPAGAGNRNAPGRHSCRSGRWRAIKKRFSKALPNVELLPPEVLAGEGRDYSAYMDYVHFNPVKHGLAAHPAEWPYSTFHHCVALGLYDLAWASPDDTRTPTGMGERP